MPTKLTVIAAGVLLFAISCTKPNPIPTIGNQFPSLGDVPVIVKVDLSKQGIQIPTDFTGISLEKGSLFSGGTYYNSDNLSFINLVKGLGPCKGIRAWYNPRRRQQRGTLQMAADQFPSRLDDIIYP